MSQANKNSLGAEIHQDSPNFFSKSKKRKIRFWNGQKTHKSYDPSNRGHQNPQNHHKKAPFPSGFGDNSMWTIVDGKRVRKDTPYPTTTGGFNKYPIKKKIHGNTLKPLQIIEETAPNFENNFDFIFKEEPKKLWGRWSKRRGSSRKRLRRRPSSKK